MKFKYKCEGIFVESDSLDEIINKWIVDDLDNTDCSNIQILYAGKEFEEIAK